MSSDLRFQAPLVIAHRGASAQCPENTWDAVSRALELGACAIEVDVQLTADGVPILFHDDDLRHFNGTAHRVSDHTWEAWQLLSPTPGNPRFSEAGVCSLERLLTGIQAERCWVNLELKAQNGDKKQYLDVILRALDHLSFPKQRVLFSSFDIDLLEQLRARYEGAIALLYQQWPDAASLEARIRSIRPFSIHCANSMMVDGLPQAVLAHQQQNNILLAVYTVNDVDQAKKFFDQGIWAVFSDHPNLYPCSF